MSNNVISGDQFEWFGDDMAFASFDRFANDCFFDSNDASCDSAFSSVGPNDGLPATTVNVVSLVDMDQPDGLQGGFFGSAFASDDTFGNVNSDMSAWPIDILTGQPGGIQDGNWPSPFTPQAPDILPAGPTTSASPTGQGTEVLPATPPSQPFGPREALWRPVMGFSPPTKVPPRPTRARAPPKPKTPKTKASAVSKPAPKPKVTKVTKKKKPAAQKRTLSILESRERSMQELYDAAWDTLSQEEKGRLLFPLLQGIDPTTGIKTAEAGTLLPPTDFEAIGVDVFGNYPQTSSPAANTTSSGHSSPSNHADYDATGAEYSPPTSNQTTVNDNELEAMGTAFVNEVSQDEDFTNHMLAALKAFNKSCDGTADPASSGTMDASQNFNNVNAFTNPDIEANTTVGRGLGGPCGNGVIGGPVQMPAPPSIYGCTRQQEALERNVMLRAQGRRR